jgi:hypothetical protein
MTRSFLSTELISFTPVIYCFLWQSHPEMSQ